jgi:hypothetical protein
MCGKHAMNMLFIKTVLAVISVMLYKFPVAIAPVVGVLGVCVCPVPGCDSFRTAMIPVEPDCPVSA